LSTLIITTDSGETITFTEEEIIEDSTGTISIKTNKFKMPLLK